jgi:hypothetical protein
MPNAGAVPSCFSILLTALLGGARSYLRDSRASGSFAADRVSAIIIT